MGCPGVEVRLKSVCGRGYAQKRGNKETPARGKAAAEEEGCVFVEKTAAGGEECGRRKDCDERKRLRQGKRVQQEKWLREKRRMHQRKRLHQWGRLQQEVGCGGRESMRVIGARLQVRRQE